MQSGSITPIFRIFDIALAQSFYIDYLGFHWEKLSLLHAELDAKNFKFAKPQIEKTDWETLELTITDPFSNRIIFWEDA